MKGAFREVTLRFRGVDYAFTPSNQLLRRIEGDGVSLISLAQQAQQRKPLISHLSLMVARCLQSVGAAVDEDQVYLDMVGDRAAEMMDLANTILVAIFPVTTPEKPAPAPAAKPAPKRKTKP